MTESINLNLYTDDIVPIPAITYIRLYIDYIGLYIIIISLTADQYDNFFSMDNDNLTA